jgi:hypothetical protein
VHPFELITELRHRSGQSSLLASRSPEKRLKTNHLALPAEAPPSPARTRAGRLEDFVLVDMNQVI